MKILEKTEDGLKRCYSVRISKEELDAAVEAKLKETAKKVRLDGFRPGKVPAEIIMRMYGEGIISESKKSAVESAAGQVLKEDKPNILLNYTTETVKDDGDGLEFTMQLEVTPAFELKDLSDIELKKHVAIIDDKHVCDQLESLREAAVKWIEDEKTDTVKDGCKVIMDLHISTSRGKKKINEEIKDVDLIVGDKGVNTEILEHLLDAKVSDIREFSISYPSDFKEKDFAGKTVEYRAHIKKIFAPSKFELDDDFAKEAGHDSLEDFKKMFVDAGAIGCERMSKDIMRRDLLDKISEMYDFPVPQNMLQIEIKEVTRQIRDEAKKMNKEFTPYIESECAKIAEKRVRLGFVIAEIAKREKINVSKNEVAQAISSVAKMYPGNEKAVWKMYSRSEALPIVVGPILEGKVVDFLLDKIKVSEEIKCSVAELVMIDEEPFDFFKDEVLPETPKELETVNEESKESEEEKKQESEEKSGEKEKKTKSRKKKAE
jgi:trigger factor